MLYREWQGDYEEEIFKKRAFLCIDMYIYSDFIIGSFFRLFFQEQIYADGRMAVPH